MPGPPGPPGPNVAKLVAGAGAGAACAAGAPPNSIAPVSAPAPTAPAAALRADRSEINMRASFSKTFVLTYRTLPEKMVDKQEKYG
jgi:hypothetical protein